MKKLSIFSWFSYPLPLEERLKLIKDAGFDATILWWAGDDKYNQPEIVRKTGLEIENIHTPFNNPNSLWKDGLDGDEYIDMLISCVDDCNKFVIPTAVIHITGFSEPPEITEAGLERIKRLVDFAEMKNVNLAFENLNFLQHLDYLFENIKSDRVGFCYDSGHENCFHPDADCLKKYGDKLFAVHLDDNFGNADTHLLPCDGTINWDSIKGKLMHCRNTSYISLEVDFNAKHSESNIYKDLSAQEYLEKAYAVTRKIAFDNEAYTGGDLRLLGFPNKTDTEFTCQDGAVWSRMQIHDLAEIRLLNVEHLPDYAGVIRKSFTTVVKDFGLTKENCPGHTSFITDERLASKFKDGYYPFGLCIADKIIGFASLTDVGDDTYEMNDVSVLPEYRHYGYGKKLLNFCKEKVWELGGNTITIGIMEENIVLKEWYTANGFIHTGTKQFEHLPFKVGFMEWRI